MMKKNTEKEIKCEHQKLYHRREKKASGRKMERRDREAVTGKHRRNGKKGGSNSAKTGSEKRDGIDEGTADICGDDNEYTNDGIKQCGVGDSENERQRMAEEDNKVGNMAKYGVNICITESAAGRGES